MTIFSHNILNRSNQFSKLIKTMLPNRIAFSGNWQNKVRLKILLSRCSMINNMYTSLRSTRISCIHNKITTTTTRTTKKILWSHKIHTEVKIHAELYFQWMRKKMLQKNNNCYIELLTIDVTMTHQKSLFKNHATKKSNEIEKCRPSFWLKKQNAQCAVIVLTILWCEHLYWLCSAKRALKMPKRKCYVQRTLRCISLTWQK